jgi:predicted nuclease of predicted toxin-antitoxin system
MKVILDEQLPDDMVGALHGHEVLHMRTMGWAGLTNGKLLAAAEREGFGVFLTADKNIPHQQNISGRDFAMIVLDVHPTNPQNLLACSDQVLAILPNVQKGQVYVIAGAHPKRQK